MSTKEYNWPFKVSFQLIFLGPWVEENSTRNLLQGVADLNSAPKTTEPSLQLEVNGAILKEEDTVSRGSLKRFIALPESYWLKRLGEKL